MIVVDDHSTDNTAKIASRYAKVTLAANPRHSAAAQRSRTLRICETINHGLAWVRHNTDYVLILGADAVIPEGYVERLIREMKRNPRLKIASGRVKGESYKPDQPQGTRIVDYRWWLLEGERSGMYTPVAGWETRLLLWAIYKGYETKVYPSLEIEAQRPRGTATRWEERGEGMKTCGYNPLQVALRAARLAAALKPGAAAKLVKGYLNSKEEAAPWTRRANRYLLRRRLTRRLRRAAAKTTQEEAKNL